MRNGAFSNTIIGIKIGFSTYCTLSNNTATSNYIGFCLYSSSHCILTHNTATGNAGNGFYLSGGYNNTLTYNTATDNAGDVSYDAGFCISSSNSTLMQNIAINNRNGIVISGGHGNLIVLNTFAGNTEYNAHDSGDSNRWDNGIHGNYWDDYYGFGVYLIPGSAGSVDNHPYPCGTAIPIIMVIISVSVLAAGVIVARIILHMKSKKKLDDAIS